MCGINSSEDEVRVGWVADAVADHSPRHVLFGGLRQEDTLHEALLVPLSCLAGLALASHVVSRRQDVVSHRAPGAGGLRGSASIGPPCIGVVGRCALIGRCPRLP